MSATEYHPITNNIDLCVRNFIEGRDTQKHINKTIEVIIKKIDETWESRQKNEIENSFKRKFIIQNETAEYFPFNDKSPMSLDYPLKLSELINEYWEKNNLFRDADQVPFKIHEFTKACYLGIAAHIENLVVDHYIKREDLKVECKITPSGYFVPDHVVSLKAVGTIAACVASVVGLFYLPFTPPIFSGGMELSFRAYPIKKVH